MTDVKVITRSPVKRLTNSRICGKLDTVKKLTWLARISFYVNLIAQEDSPEGSYPRFMGEFKSYNFDTGEILTSGNGVFPSVLSDIIEKAKGDKAPNITGIYDVGVELHEGRNRFLVKCVVPAAIRPVLDLLEAATLLEDESASEPLAT
jgi:hypothetical protein